MCFGIVRSSASGEKRDSGTKVKAALCRRFFGNRLNRYSKSVYPKIHTTPLFPKMEISTCRSEVNATGSDLFLCDSILGINNVSVTVQPRRRHKPVMSVKIQDTTCDKERFQLVFHGFLQQKSHLSSCDGLVQDSLLNASERLDLLEKALQGPIGI